MARRSQETLRELASGKESSHATPGFQENFRKSRGHGESLGGRLDEMQSFT